MRGDYAAFWKRPYRDFYVPVTYSAWTFIAHSPGTDDGPATVLRPESFRTVNLLVHAVNSVLVLWLVYVLIESWWPALLGAVFFSIHPLQVESVVWISELRGLLAALFSLIALLLYCCYRRAGSTRTALNAVATVSFLLAILAKPSATTLPILVLAVDVLFYRGRLPRRWWLWALAWAVAAIPVMIVAKHIQPNIAVEFIPRLPARLLVVADALTFYLGKLLAPWPLSPSYGRTPASVIGWRLFDILWVIPPTILLLAWRFRRRYPEIALASVIAFISLVPVLGLVPFKGQNFSTVADRYMYFPMVGSALLVAAVASRTRMTRTFWIVAVGIGTALLFLNVRYQAVWRNEMTLWSHAATTYPNQPRVHNNYGAALQATGLQDEAIAQFNLALQALPTFADAYCNRGSSFGRLHRYSEALSDQSRALQLDPTDGGCWYNRAVTLLSLGKFDQALQDVERAEGLGEQPPPGFKEAIRRRMLLTR
jgi:hypothetical protein